MRLKGLRDLIGLLRPYSWQFALGVVLLLGAAAPNLLYPQASKWAVDQVTAAADSETGLRLMYQAALFVAALAVAQAVLIWFRHYLMTWLGERVVADLRLRVFQKLTLFSPHWFHQKNSGEIVGRISSDVGKIENVVGSQLSMAMRQGVVLVGALVLLALESPMLTIYMLSVVPPLALLTIVFGRYIRRISRFVQDQLATSNAHLEETVSGIDTVQAFVREPHEVQRYGQKIESVFKAGISLGLWRATFMSSTSLFGFLSMGLILWLGGRQVVLGEMSAGGLVAFMMYTTTVAGSIATLASVWGGIQGAIGATERIFEVLGEVPDIQSPQTPLALPDGPAEVHFRGVSYAYPARPDERVLREIELTIPAGQTVALVGESGAGKSTLSSLLLRYYDPEEGAVLFNGVDLRQLELQTLRSSLAIVRQEPMLFSGSVAENISFARPDASSAELQQAAEQAAAHRFISQFEEGYQTPVGERGVQLSVGQKQRIAIARAILADPKLLILDEATSNLDAASEAAVQGALDNLMQGRTTLVVAHRLSTIKNADLIVVMRQGEIAERGRHDELMGQDGYYRHLVEHQLIRDDGLAAPTARVAQAGG